MIDLTLTRLREEQLQAVLDLALAQEVRHHASDPRLRPARTRAQVEASLLLPGEPVLVVLNGQGRVRGAARAGVWELAAGSILHAFLSPRNGVAHSLVLPDPGEEDAQAVAATLLAVLSDHWQRQQTTGDLVRWPSSDPWLEPLLAARGFRLDSVCAMRSLQPLEEAARASVGLSASSSFLIHPARPADEGALLRLFEEELRFHEQYTPFVRSNPAALAALRRKLARLWAGASLVEGAPLVLVAEQVGEIVAMAENSLLVLGPEDEPGFTPPGQYGCIDNVSVHAPWRGQGLGHLLVQAVAEAFAAAGLALDGWLLWYNPDNPQAARFWSRLGFDPLWTTYQRLHPTP